MVCHFCHICPASCMLERSFHLDQWPKGVINAFRLVWDVCHNLTKPSRAAFAISPTIVCTITLYSHQYSGKVQLGLHNDQLVNSLDHLVPAIAEDVKEIIQNLQINPASLILYLLGFWRNVWMNYCLLSQTLSLYPWQRVVCLRVSCLHGYGLF